MSKHAETVTQDEIAQARADWEDRRRFGDVAAYKGPRLNAPSLVRFARPFRRADYAGTGAGAVGGAMAWREIPAAA